MSEGNESSTIPWVDENAIIENHDTLYHYTAFINLRAILETGGLFASPYTETNDRSEFLAAGGILCPKIYEYSKSSLKEQFPDFIDTIMHSGADPDEELRKDAWTFYRAGLSTRSFRPHLACFSYHSEDSHKQNGILTMWRSYGGDEGGIALGFCTKQLVEKSRSLQSKLGFPVIYLDYALYGASDQKLVERLTDVQDLTAAYFEFIKAQMHGAEPTLDWLALRKLLVLSCSTKHADFHDEREIRLVVARPEENSIKYEPLKQFGTRMIIEVADCLSEVLVGPSKDQGAIGAAVTHILKECGREDVQIRYSNTPFRKA